MRIISGGNVGIGTTSPWGKLSVRGAGTGTGIGFLVADSADSPKMVVLDNGNVGVGTVSPTFYSGYTTLAIGNASNGGVVDFVTGSLPVGQLSNTLTQFNITTNAYGKPIAIDGSKILLNTNSGGNVGIGTTTPTYKLSINSSNSTDNLFQIATTTNQNIFTVLANGNVGIGTSNPAGKLAVYLNNTDYTNTAGANSHIYLDNPSATGQNVLSSVINGTLRGKWRTDYLGNVNWVAGGGDHWFYSGTDGNVGSFQMIIKNGGNVGIGTTGPGEKLSITNNGSYAAMSVGNGTNNSYFGYANTATNYNTNSLAGDAIIRGYNGVAISGGNGSSGSGGASGMRIDSSGNVGIGTTNPTQGMLQVNGTIASLNSTASSLLQMYGVVGGVNRIDSYENTSGGNIAFATNLAGGGVSEKMRITSSGNVGIGTTSPSYNLDVVGNQSSAVILRAYNSDSVGTGAQSGFMTKSDTAQTILTAHGSARTAIQFGLTLGGYTQLAVGAGNGLIVGSVNSAPVVIGTNNLERMRFDVNGNVGIGTTSPFSRLSVTGAGTGTGRGFSVADSSNVDNFYVLDNGNAYMKGNVGIGTTGPTEKLDVNGSMVARGGALVNQTSAATYAFDNAGANIYSFGADTSTYGAFRLTASKSNGTPLVRMAIDNQGNVGIGTTGPAVTLDIPAYNTTNSQVRFGSMEFIPYALTNSAITDNAYYNGGYKYRNTGYATDLQINDGSGNLFFRNAPSGTAGAAATMTERLTILNTGNVGIGTATPGSKLEVNGDVKITAGSGGRFIFQDGSSMTSATGGGGVGVTSWGDLTYTTGGAINFQTGTGLATSTKMVVTNAGLVGIGTASPVAKLDVMGATRTGTHSASLAAGYITGNLSQYDGFRIVHSNGTQGIAFGYSGIRKVGNDVFTGSHNLTIDATDTGNLLLQTISTGNVGIGTTNPVVLFTVQNSVSTDFNEMVNVLAPSAANGVHTAGIYFGRARATDELGHLTFVPSATTQKSQIRLGIWGRNDLLNIEGTGNVGIGTTNPGKKLSVIGNAEFADGAGSTIELNPTSTSLFQRNVGATTDTILTIGNGAADTATFKANGNVYMSGNVGIGTTNPSSYKLYVANGTGSNVATTFDVGYTAASDTFGAIDIFRSGSNTVGDGIGYIFSALDSGSARQEYAEIVGQIESNTG
ncbi:MAG: hypothetical protein PHD04_01555, partial [Candidatus Pacebacteria bacterium]|nr:hypothetical protein [Candidatus Paceibacterota bacterium]